MSSFGIGGLIMIGLLLNSGILLPIVQAALVGAAAVGAFALVGGIVNIINDAAEKEHRKHLSEEKTRQEKIKSELKAVQREFANQLINDQTKMEEMEQRASDEMHKAVIAMNNTWRDLAVSLGNVNNHTQQSLKEVEQNVHNKLDIMKKQTSESIQEIGKSIVEKSMQLETELSMGIDASYRQKLAELNNIVEERAAREVAFKQAAQNTLQEAEALKEALMRAFDCEIYAPRELQAVNTRIELLKQQIEQGLGENAFATASSCKKALRMLQHTAELNTAYFARNKAMVESVAVGLNEYLKISDQLHFDGETEEIEQMNSLISVRRNMEYWSEGRMSILQKSARNLIECCKNYRYTGPAVDGSADTVALTLLNEANDMQQKIVNEMIRTRSFIVSRIASEKMAMKQIDAYQMEGWQFTGSEFDQNDYRRDLLLHFEKNGTRRTVRMHVEYDEEARDYKMQVIRKIDQDAGMIINETQRQQDDESINRRLGNSGVPEEFQPICVTRTIGMAAGANDDLI